MMIWLSDLIDDQSLSPKKENKGYILYFFWKLMFIVYKLI